jgi:hypothetical protein
VEVFFTKSTIKLRVNAGRLRRKREGNAGEKLGKRRGNVFEKSRQSIAIKKGAPGAPFFAVV